MCCLCFGFRRQDGESCCRGRRNRPSGTAAARVLPSLACAVRQAARRDCARTGARQPRGSLHGERLRNRTSPASGCPGSGALCPLTFQLFILVTPTSHGSSQPPVSPLFRAGRESPAVVGREPQVPETPVQRGWWRGRHMKGCGGQSGCGGRELSRNNGGP